MIVKVIGLICILLVLRILTIKTIKSLVCKEKDCEGTFWTYLEIIHKGLYLLWFIEVLKLFGFSIASFIASCGVVFAAFGFALRDVISDLANGVIILTTHNVYIGARVRTDCGCNIPVQESEIDDFTLFSLKLLNDDGTTKYIRYHTIQSIEIVDD